MRPVNCVIPENSKIDNVQILRGVAAFLVLSFHVWSECKHYSLIQVADGSVVDLIMKGASSGVDLFFVISGFIIVYISHARIDRHDFAKTFLRDRSARVIPLYWFYMTAYLVIFEAVPGAVRRDAFPFGYIISSYLFYPMPAPGTGTFIPALSVGWTLNYEIFFYLVFALVGTLVGRRVVLWLVLIFVIIAGLGSFLPPTTGPLWFWSRPLILEFAFGAMIGWLKLHGVLMPHLIRRPLIAGAVLWWLAGSIFLDPDWRVVSWGIPASIIASVFILRSTKLDKPPGFIRRSSLRVGDASYSLYLSHLFTIRILNKLLLVGGLTSLKVTFFVAACLVGAPLVAILCFLWTERPIVSIARMLLRRDRSFPQSSQSQPTPTSRL